MNRQPLPQEGRWRTSRRRRQDHLLDSPGCPRHDRHLTTPQACGFAICLPTSHSGGERILSSGMAATDKDAARIRLAHYHWRGLFPAAICMPVYQGAGVPDTAILRGCSRKDGAAGRPIMKLFGNVLAALARPSAASDPPRRSGATVYDRLPISTATSSGANAGSATAAWAGLPTLATVSASASSASARVRK